LSFRYVNSYQEIEAQCLNGTNPFSKAEMALFKVHKFLLAQHSEIINDMLNTANDDGDGTLEKPLVLHDKARAWEVLLLAFYRR
jgi:hypothetical protein